MSSLLMNANLLDTAVEADLAQNFWTRGVTQGATFKILSGIHAETVQSLVDSTLAAKRKTEQWIREAKKTGTDIDIEGIIDALQWTTNDIADVAAQSNQLPIINLQRENTIWQFHCCYLIREVTKKVIYSTVKQASQRINLSDTFQAGELIKLSLSYLNAYSYSEHLSQNNIDLEEMKSRRLRQEFLRQVSMLLKAPSIYKAIAIRENMRIAIDSTCQEMRLARGITKEANAEIDKVRNKAMKTLGALQLTTAEEMHAQCDALLAQVNRICAIILITISINTKRMNTPCRAEATH